jgi:hypothetical protein
MGGLVCLGAALGGALFLYGISVRSYWALALPLAAGVLFVLGLVFWVGWTILTVRVEAEGVPLEPEGTGPSAPTAPAPSTAEPPPAQGGANDSRD